MSLREKQRKMKKFENLSNEKKRRFDKTIHLVFT